MNALIPLANGCEEMEVVIVMDTLRRAGWKVMAAGLSGGVVKAARGVRLVPDENWDEVHPEEFDILILPGGFDGTTALCEHVGVQQALKDFAASGRWVASICAAALALHEAELLAGKRFTCYPGVGEKLPDTLQPVDQDVVVDGRMMTSQGPGTAFEFALKMIEIHDGSERAAAIRADLLLNRSRSMSKVDAGEISKKS